MGVSLLFVLMCFLSVVRCPGETVGVVDTDELSEKMGTASVEELDDIIGVEVGVKGEMQLEEDGEKEEACEKGEDCEKEEDCEKGEDCEKEEEEDSDHLIGIGQPTHNKFTAFIHNYNPHPVHLYWRNKREGGEDQDWGILEPTKSKSFSTFQGHEWFVTHPDTGEELQSIYVTEEVPTYVLEPKEVRDARDQELEKEKAVFRKEYKQKTGKNWIQVYPREPVAYHMWESGEIGRKQYAETDCALWYNQTDAECTDDCEVDMSRPEPDDFRIEIETLSVEPQVFAIHNVMSTDEADLIIQTVQGRMKRSTVKTSGIISPDRTSETAWVGHSQGPIFENIFDRIGDVLGIERIKLRNSYSAESLQVVHYNVGGQYKGHHDFLDPAIHRENQHVSRGNNRLATFLFYLHVPDEGGHTSFPKSTAGPKGEGIKVKMPKGSAVLFYSMMPDGNLDDMTLHAGTPVEAGEKYIANLWIWEPRFR